MSCSLKSGKAKFTSALLKEVESSSLGNWVVSPHSLHSTFSGVLQGAGGRTQSQLEDVLGVHQGETLLEQYRTLNTQLVTSAGGAMLKEANLLAFSSGLKLKPAYSSQLLRGSEIREFNFDNDSINSVREINHYVAVNTNYKIPELLSNNDVDSITRLILVNAVYFQADWKFPFPLGNTAKKTFQLCPQQFHAVSSSSVLRDFMMLEAKVRVLEDTTRQLDIMELPYKDPSKAMLIVLPKPGVSTHNIVERMDGLHLDDVRRNGRLADTVISIPKFKLKYQTFLKETMTLLGAGDMFTDTADLSGMSNEPLSVTEGVHQAFIEVNKEGTEAAAATAVEELGVVKLRRFKADRPFLFVVYDFDQNVALFAGKLMDPSITT